MAIRKNSIRVFCVYLLTTTFIAVLSAFLAGCAEIQVRPLPPAPQTAKLQVFVLPLSGSPPPGGWGTPHQEFFRNQIRAIRTILEETGIYQIPKREDYLTVVGKEAVSNWEWKKKNWALAKQVGQALSADYVFVLERDFNANTKFYQTLLINLETGKQFKVSLRVPRGPEHREEWQQIGRVAYAEIFRDAKNDMLATAMRKGRLWASKIPGPIDGGARDPIGPRPADSSKERTILPSAPPKVREVALEESMKEVPASGSTRLAIYDIHASEPFKIAALILSEALREEFFRLGSFTLVNRENMAQILNEIGVQQTGLVEEKQAVQAGKGMAARQIILGQFGSIGNTLLLQVKRIDVETQSTLSIGSAKCTPGKEDEVLAGLPELARKLAGQ
jgi:hypothetical protein